METKARTEAPRRPMLRYHGGKWRLAPWIISHFPEHRVYVEPYGGAASVLLRKPRSYGEVWNDLWDELLNLFQVLREEGERLAELVRLTPYHRSEYALSFEPVEDRVEMARRTLVRSYMRFGSDSLNRALRSGFRANSNRGGTTPANDWKHFPEAIPEIVERFRGVTLDCRPAIEVMDQQDSRETLHYCDPPYLHGTRSRFSAAGRGRRDAYEHEMTDEEHVEMCRFLKGLKGMVLVSGYDNQVYREELDGWRTSETVALADGARPRKEMLWMNFDPPERRLSLGFPDGFEAGANA